MNIIWFVLVSIKWWIWSNNRRKLEDNCPASTGLANTTDRYFGQNGIVRTPLNRVSICIICAKCFLFCFWRVIRHCYQVKFVFFSYLPYNCFEFITVPFHMIYLCCAYLLLHHLKKTKWNFYLIAFLNYLLNLYLPFYCIWSLVSSAVYMALLCMMFCPRF